MINTSINIEKNSLFKELKTSLSFKKTIEKIIASFHDYTLKKEIENKIEKIIKNINVQKKHIEKTRNYIEKYYVNNIKVDEKLLMEFYDFIEFYTEAIEGILDSQELNNLPEDIRKNIYDIIDSLYSELVNTNFLISQKISQAYLDSKSNIELLENA